jgi:hypothetical protein
VVQCLPSKREAKFKRQYCQGREKRIAVISKLELGCVDSGYCHMGAPLWLTEDNPVDLQSEPPCVDASKVLQVALGDKCPAISTVTVSVT